MATFTVDCTSKDRDGDITDIGGPDGRKRWKHTKAAALKNIKNGHSYVVKAGGKTVQVKNIIGKYLRSTADGRRDNNLDNLKNC